MMMNHLAYLHKYTQQKDELKICQVIKKRKIMDEIRDVMRLHHYSIHTAGSLSMDLRSNIIRLHHIDPSVVNKAIKNSENRTT